MDKLHNTFLQKFSLYKKWHEWAGHTRVHWLILALVSFIIVWWAVSIPFSDLEESNLAKVATKFSVPDSRGNILKALPDHILVKFKDSLPEPKKSEILRQRDLKERSEIKPLGIKIIALPANASPEKAADELKLYKDSIEFAEPDYMLSPSFIPNDPWFVNWQKDKQQINAPAAWDSVKGGSNLILAVADTGIDCSHEDLAMDCIVGWNFYDNNSDTHDVVGHGTAVAGVVAATGNNGIGVAGAVWNSKIMPLRVSDPSGLASYSSIASAVVYAADHGVKVVNNSYQSGGSLSVRNAAHYLNHKGGLLVVSAGNAGSATGYRNNSDIVTVSAVDADDRFYAWSNFGDNIDVSAPGCAGATTVNGGGYMSFCGTSNSAPEVAGVLALVWSVNPALSPDAAEDIIFKSAKDLGASGWDQYFGWGRIDAGAAVNLAKGFTSNSRTIK